MSFALLKLSKDKSVLKTIKPEKKSFLKEKYALITTNIKVSNKFLKVVAASVVFTSAIASTANQAQAQDYQVANQGKTQLVSTQKKMENYTGLVIIIKNHKIKDSMSPKILSSSGKSVYGNMKDLTDEQVNYVVSDGIAAYTENLPDAKIRSGDNPLIIEALNIVNNDNIIISDDDALKIINENNNMKFLENFKVSLIREY
jgi:hypothetical protein